MLHHQLLKLLSKIILEQNAETLFGKVSLFSIGRTKITLWRWKNHDSTNYDLPTSQIYGAADKLRYILIQKIDADIAAVE